MGRMFFAIWPEAQAASELARVAEALAQLVGGRPMPAAKIHLTLAFLGTLDERQRKDAIAAAGQVRGTAIGMVIDTVGSFRGAKVGWAAPAGAHPGLVALQSALAEALRGREFALEDRAFTPHVTLVRKIERPVPPAPLGGIEWRSDALTLVESTGDGRYEARESWKLGGN